MSYLASICLFLGALGLSFPSYSHEEESTKQQESTQKKPAMKPAYRLELSPTIQAIPGKTTTMRLRLFQNGKPLTFNELKEVHTEKLHLLVIEPSLSDYHHLHPKAGKEPGEFVFEFKPNKSGSYRVWADFTPIATNQQEYAWADMGVASSEKVSVNSAERHLTVVGGYTFRLALDGVPREGEAVMGTISIAKEGKPFTQLEPIMGAFAHVVGFGADYNSVLHIHPMGDEPSKDSDRGGPVLSIHIEPEKPGFVALFVQVRIDGKELFAPLGMVVKAKSAESKPH